jgi:hypothetical protein
VKEGQIASEIIREAIRRELASSADVGAGLAELLDQLQQASGRLRWRRRLSDAEMDDLRLYCWTLHSSKPTGLLWGEARELWGGVKITRPVPKRRARA